MNTAVLMVLLCRPLAAQDATRIVLVEPGEKMMKFSVTMVSDKKGNVATDAMVALFHALLDDGIEGVADGKRLMKKNNRSWYNNFFKVKNPPYMAYVKGYQTEGDPQKNEYGKYEATVLIKVNIEFLIRQLKAYGVA